MEPPANTAQTWRFGVFEVDADRMELRRGGTRVKMRDQPLRILIFLLQNAGEIVTREDLRVVLWSSDIFVDFDHSLNTAVMKLRSTLGDSADAPLYIETIPRRGYRFIAPVSAGNGAAAIPGSPAVASVSPVPAESAAEPAGLVRAPRPFMRARVAFGMAQGPPIAGTARSRPHGQPAAVAFVLLAIVAGTMILLRSSRSLSSPGDANQVVDVLPVTTASGDAIDPAFSPDGREVAFVSDGPDRRRYDLYVQLLGADLPLRLTYSKSGLLGTPAWSPDGTQLAFSRCDGVNDGVYVVPALGGEERKLTRVQCSSAQPGPVAWTPDAKGLLMVDRCSEGGPFGVVLFSFSTGEKRCLTASAALKGADAGSDFTLSPDGKTLGFRRMTVGCCDIFALPLGGGAAKQLTNDEADTGCSTLAKAGCGGLMWTPDSRSLVFVSGRTTLPSLWRVPVAGGPVAREVLYPSIGSFSKDGKRLAFSDTTSEELPAIWRADLSRPGGPVMSNRKLISSQYPELDAQPSPDGSRLAWMSIRTGFEELWTGEASGGNPLQVTHLRRSSGTPRWSPDGKRIAFDSQTEGRTQIFIADGEGRNLQEVTGGPYDSVVPSWSRDGKSIYFASNRTGAWQVWRHVLEGGADTQVTHGGGYNAFESEDGQTVYFSRLDQAGLWSVPSRGGPESLIVADRPQVGYWGYWALTRTGIYLLNAEAEPRPGVEFYSFATQRTSPVFTLDQHPVRLQPSLSATPDGKTVYYAQYDRQSVIKMAEFAH